MLKQVQHDKVRDCRATLAMTRGEQRGRSMVEMLGVLAVIGVLSVAGIAGYSVAMQSYRTNEILNATSMFYVLAMAQNAGNGPSGTTPVNYASVGGTDPSGATLAYNPTDKKITITFTDIKDASTVLNDRTTHSADTAIFVITGETNIQTVRDFLNLSNIEYEES
jgi:type II secretory pathway pseudopilin PulG